MDLSKLPKMSQTPNPPDHTPDPQGDPQRPPQRPADHEPLPMDAGVGGAVWISIALGVVMMLLGRSFVGWALAKLTGRPHSTGVDWMAGPKAGQPVEYWELQGLTAWTDSGLFLFGLAMVLEGLMLAVLNSSLSHRAKLLAVGCALFLGVAATGYNLLVVVRLMGIGITPLMSILAVAFGVYMVLYEWKLLRVLRGKPVGLS